MKPHTEDSTEIIPGNAVTAPEPTGTAAGETSTVPEEIPLTSATGDLRRILAAPCLPLGRWPTPIETVPFLGRRLLVKRDDLSGFGRGGAKTRKIEHILGRMRAEGYDELITVIGNITNLGFDLLPALRAHGFSWRIFVQNDPPLPTELRSAIFRGIESDVRFLGESRLASAARVTAEWIRRRAAGRKPFLLLPGASHPAGVLGNARGFIEMAHQLRAAGRPLPEKIFVSVATGTTVAGFLIAENALRQAGFAPVQIVGVQVYHGNVVRRTRHLLHWTERQLGLQQRVDPARIEIHADALEGGFGHAGPELADLCRRVQSDTGLSLDPIFGGKTWAVMEKIARQEPPANGSLMFWHCGHTLGWEALVESVRSSHGRPAGSSAKAAWTGSQLAIIAVYAAVFYGAFPLFLWSFGDRLDATLGLPPLQGLAVLPAGIVLLVAGVAIILSSTLSLFRTGRGLPISHLPPNRLVDLGSYAWTRHPHYVGYNLAVVGWGLLQESWGVAIGAGLLLLGLWLLYALVFEEPRLLRRFGQGYACYRTSVPILPVPSPGRMFQGFVRRLQRPLEALANRLVLFRTGPILWVTYGLFAALGGALMSFGVAWFLLDRGWSGLATWGATAVVSAAIPLMSRAAWFVVPGDKPDVSFLQLFRRVGFVSWGGYVAAFGTAAWIGSRAGIPPLRMLDIIMLTGLFASTVSRWGCLAYGCCIGQGASWGLRWTEPESWIHRLRPGSSAPRIPTQVLSSLHAGAAGLLLLALSLRPSAPGTLAALGGLLYALPRFGVEHLRDEARFGRWQLTSGQIGCGVMFSLCLGLLYFLPAVPAPLWSEHPPLAAWPWLLTAALTTFGIEFLAYGPHWKRIGRW